MIVMMRTTIGADAMKTIDIRNAEAEALAVMKATIRNAIAEAEAEAEAIAEAEARASIWNAQP